MKASTTARRLAAFAIEHEANGLHARIDGSHQWAIREYGGRCSMCRDQWLVVPEELQPLLVTPPGKECPMRHFVGQVAALFEIVSALPRRRKNAIVRRLWAMFPEARADLVKPEVCA